MSYVFTATLELTKLHTRLILIQRSISSQGAQEFCDAGSVVRQLEDKLPLRIW